jgi:hypothetical protein
MPMKNMESTYDGGWFTVKWCAEPTDLDPHGCDGLYIKSCKIKWWGWIIAALPIYIRSKLL